ncbi:C39 family peptidase [Candidatus Falkowbacteria bacterium]|jgi:hypothetical protein|nr:C39 family peptidase [Candidatus Falkowbacteria bacterium]MBT4432959.1 C39 family peptidase [Candidatus Falkowbacteria bacterium]
MKQAYFIFTILICLPLIGVFIFQNNNFDKELVLMYDELLFDFEKLAKTSLKPDQVLDKKIENTSEDENKKDENIKEKEEKIEFEVLPNKIHYNVPFTSQAPFRDWSYPWQEFCEEAAVLITMRYFDGRGIKDKDDANDALQEIMKWENENLGFYKDTTATTTMKIITDFYEYDNVELSHDTTIEKIKQELAKGNLIIIPTAGRNLENPYFTPPGPIYHNLVLVGYDNEKQIFYTNDPGIMSGKDFKYSYKNIIESIADWSYEKETIDKSRKVMIIVRGG